MNLPTAPRTHWPSVLQFAVGVLAGGACWLGAVGALTAGWMTSKGEPAQASGLMSLAWTLGFLGLLGFLSAWYALRRLSNRPAPAPVRRDGLRRASLAMILWGLILAAGSRIATLDQVAWLVLPPLQVMAVAIPLWWMVETARSGLSTESPQRTWGVFTFGLFVSTPLIIVIEGVLIVAGLVGVGILVAIRPDWAQALPTLRIDSLQANPDPQQAIEALRPLVSNPWVGFGVLALISGLIPMIEETFKPLAVWFARPSGGREGFSFGILCGAAFALIETLFTASTPAGASWTALMIVRVGTGLLHIALGGLTGWALAEALQRRSYLRLGLVYTVAVLLHGLWNAFSILNGYAGLVDPATQNFARSLGNASPYALGVMAAGFLFFLFRANRRLRRDAASS